MNPNTGEYRELVDDEQPTPDEVLVVGTPEQVETLSKAVKGGHPQGPSSSSLGMLKALQRKPVYQGTVAPADKAHRRAKGKVAKASRKTNRGRR